MSGTSLRRKALRKGKWVREKLRRVLWGGHGDLTGLKKETYRGGEKKKKRTRAPAQKKDRLLP